MKKSTTMKRWPLPLEFASWMEYIEHSRAQEWRTVTVVKKPELKEWVQFVDLIANYLNTKFVWVIWEHPSIYSSLIDLFQVMLYSAHEHSNSKDANVLIKYLDINYLLTSQPSAKEFKSVRNALPEYFSYKLYWKWNIYDYYRLCISDLRSTEEARGFLRDLCDWDSPLVIKNDKIVNELDANNWDVFDDYFAQFRSKIDEFDLVPLDKATLQDTYLIEEKTKLPKEYTEPTEEELFAKKYLKSLAVLEKRLSVLKERKADYNNVTKITIEIYDYVLSLNWFISLDLSDKLSWVIKSHLEYIKGFYWCFDKFKEDPKYNIEQHTK